MKGRTRTSRTLTDCREDLLELGLNRAFAIKPPRRLGNREEDGRIVSEAVDEALHIETLKRAQEAIHRRSDLMIL